MVRKRQSSASLVSETIVATDTFPIEDLLDTTVEDYKKLNEKVDKVRARIKERKEQTQRKK